MRSRLQQSQLADIAEKVEARVRLTFDEGVRLFKTPDLLSVGWLANRERERRHGARTYFNHNLRLEATNMIWFTEDTHENVQTYIGGLGTYF